MKLYIAVVIGLMLLVLAACSPPLENATPEVRCEATGGMWKEFSSSCADTCSFNRGETDLCAQVITESCECGTGSCWNGTACAPI